MAVSEVGSILGYRAM